MYKFISRLRELRLEQGKTQNEMAEQLKIPQRTYSNYEQGKAQPDLELLCRMADVLETSADYLLGRTQTPTEEPIQSEAAMLFDALPSEVKPIAILYLQSLLTVNRKQ